MIIRSRSLAPIGAAVLALCAALAQPAAADPWQRGGGRPGPHGAPVAHGGHEGGELLLGALLGVFTGLAISNAVQPPPVVVYPAAPPPPPPPVYYAPPQPAYYPPQAYPPPAYPPPGYAPPPGYGAPPPPPPGY